MGLLDNHEPAIVKEGNSARQQLAALEALRGSLPHDAEKQLEFDIRSLQAGISGEDRILYELRNSHMEMYILQDLFLERDGLTAQIDFLVLTLQRTFVIECKNLFGDLVVSERGDFIRSFGGKKKEGIYSPITQNRRHLDLIHAMRRDTRGTALNLLVDANFDDIYRGLVVLANPKTVLDDRNAKQEVSDQIIRADQLIATIKAMNNEKGPGREKSFRKHVQELAQWFAEQHRQNPVDYTAKYRKLSSSRNDVHQRTAQAVICPRCGAPMVLRTAKRGERAGKQFYGCSKYPSCRGIVNIE